MGGSVSCKCMFGSVSVSLKDASASCKGGSRLVAS
jgi:hypothetical protein